MGRRTVLQRPLAPGGPHPRLPAAGRPERCRRTPPRGTRTTPASSGTATPTGTGCRPRGRMGARLPRRDLGTALRAAGRDRLVPRHLAGAPSTRWEAGFPTRGACTTCSATSGTGAGTCTTPRCTAATGYCGAAAGSTSTGAAGPRCGAAAIPPSGWTTWASGSLGAPPQQEAATGPPAVAAPVRHPQAEDSEAPSTPQHPSALLGTPRHPSASFGLVHLRIPPPAAMPVRRRTASVTAGVSMNAPTASASGLRHALPDAPVRPGPRKRPAPRVCRGAGGRGPA